MRNKFDHERLEILRVELYTKTLALPWKKRHANSQAKTSMATEQLWYKDCKRCLIYGRKLKIHLFLVQYPFFSIHHTVPHLHQSE